MFLRGMICRSAFMYESEDSDGFEIGDGIVVFPVFTQEDTTKNKELLAKKAVKKLLKAMEENHIEKEFLVIHFGSKVYKTCRQEFGGLCEFLLKTPYPTVELDEETTIKMMSFSEAFVDELKAKAPGCVQAATTGSLVFNFPDEMLPEEFSFHVRPPKPLPEDGDAQERLSTSG